jgi:hypothetical protein
MESDPMVDIREIALSVHPPSDGDWVLIEGFRGKFAAKGSLAKNDRVPFGPSLFADLYSAMEASRVWAEENRVPVIYVKIVI